MQSLGDREGYIVAQSFYWSVISGIAYFVCIGALAAFAVFENKISLSENLMSLNILVLVAALICYICFIRGFQILGGIRKASLARALFYVLCACGLVYYGWSIAVLMFPHAPGQGLRNAALVLFGLVNGLCARVLWQEEISVGLPAQIAALLFLAGGIGFVSVISAKFAVWAVCAAYMFTAAVFFILAQHNTAKKALI